MLLLVAIRMLLLLLAVVGVISRVLGSILAVAVVCIRSCIVHALGVTT